MQYNVILNYSENPRNLENHYSPIRIGMDPKYFRTSHIELKYL